MTKLFPLILVWLFACSLTLRLIGLNWDAGQHLHPDERFLTQVTTSLKAPASLAEFLDPAHSPANPHNVGYSYYVYGTFPIFMVKLAAVALNADNYDQALYVGRVASAVVDSLSGLILALLAIRLGLRRKTALVSQAVYAVLPLPLQLAHFYTVDPWLVLCLLIAIYSYLKWSRPGWATAAGIATGLALACKIQAYVFLPLAALLVLIQLRGLRWSRIVLCGLLCVLAGFTALRVGQPYLFATGNFFEVRPNPKVLANWRELEHLYNANTYATDHSGVFFPPAAMFISTKNLIFMPLNLMSVGLGLPFALLTLIGMVIAARDYRRRQLSLSVLLVVIWVIGVILYQSTLFAKYLRYLALIYPYLALCSALALSWLSRQKFRVLGLVLLLLGLLFPAGLVYMYTQPHPRVAASQWIYSHLSADTAVTSEHWDDPLPLCLPGYPCPTVQQLELKLFDADTASKWSTIISQLNQADYVMLSSNRVYGSLSWLPDRYPVTARFYQALFSGQLGFVLDQQFLNRPRLPLPGLRVCLPIPDVGYGKIAQALPECPDPGLSIVDDYVDESFTVYDHPRVLIFKKVTPVDYASVLSAPQ